MNQQLGAVQGLLFSDFGGRYVPEVLATTLDDLLAAWQWLKDDPDFRKELDRLGRTYSGRPPIVTETPKFARHAGGVRIILKHEDLNHAGSHKINNVLRQVLLTKAAEKTRIITGTRADQHGVATVTAAALLNLDCTICMGVEDVRRQTLNMARIELLGTKVISVTAGPATLKDAINEAFRDWVTNVETTNYVFGTTARPYPFPALVRNLQKVIGEEARAQVFELTGKLPDVVVVCIGGGSGAIGLFNAFLDDPSVRPVGCETSGSGTASGKTAAATNAGSPGIFHGSMSYLMQDEDGQTVESHSISAGLDYPGVGSEHVWLHSIGRAEYRVINDDAAMGAFRLLTHKEGILPAIESAHALTGILQIGLEVQTTGNRPPTIFISLSGRGGKDVQTAMDYFGIESKGETL